MASRFFLIAVLPILGYLFIFPNYVVSQKSELSLFGILWFANILVFGNELFKGHDFSSKMAMYVSNFYFISSITYVALVSTDLSSPLIIALILAIPQISIYAYKIGFKKEFGNKMMKFISRLLFISAFFFSLTGWITNPLTRSIFIIVGALIFVRLRSFSKYRVDPSINLNYKVKIFGTYIDSYFDEDGNLTKIPDQGLKKYFIEFLFLLLFIIGVLGLTPSLLCSSMTTNNLALAVGGVPLIAMSSKNICSNCGAPLKPADQFCEACGVQVSTSTQNTNFQQPQQQYREPIQGGYQPNQGGYQPYGGGGTYNQGQRYGNRHSTSAPILFGVLIGFFVLILTQNIIFALLMGVIAYFGARWAESVDNPCLAFCILDQCLDCICSATSSEMQRKGKF